MGETSMENLNSTFNILWRGRYVVLLCVLLGALGAIVSVKLASKTYEASGLIQVQADLPGGGAAEVLGLQQASQGLAGTYARLITARSFLARIRPQVAGGQLTTSELVTRVSASPVSQNAQNTNLVDVSATGGSPSQATTLANDVMGAFVALVNRDASDRAAQQQSQLQERISALTAQIDKLTPSATKVPIGPAAEQVASLRAARTALTNELASSIANAVSQEGSVTPIAPATASSAPISPRPMLDVLAGIALGLVVGVGVAWLRHLLDRELHSSAEVAGLVDVPVLASIPLRRNADADDFVIREAFDVLWTNLNFVTLEDPLKVVTITSHEAGEGKTATAEGLARAAARLGVKVLLVDGDLRTGALSARLGKEGPKGLSNLVARGGADVLELIRSVGPSLSLLACGPRPPNAPSILASSAMTAIVERLRDHYDLIVIDSPPVGGLADPAILAGLSDGVIVAARVGRTDRPDLVSAVTSLRRTPTPVVGTVVFEPRAIDATYYAIDEGMRGPASTRASVRASARAEKVLDLSKRVQQKASTRQRNEG